MLPEQEKSRTHIVFIIISVLSVSLVFFLRVNKSMWLDEAYSVHVAGGSFVEIIAELCNDSGPPLYYFLLSSWIKVFGISEFGVRSLSIVFYVFSLIAVYFTGKSLYDRPTGRLCSFLYMVSHLSMAHALNARAYSLLGLTGTVSTFFFLRIFLCKISTKKELALYIALNIAGTFTHYWFTLVILSHMVCYTLLFSRYKFKEFILIMFLSLAPFVLLWSPILFGQIENGSTSWLQKPDIIFSFINAILHFFGGRIALAVYAAVFLLIIIQVEKAGLKMRASRLLKEHLFDKRTLSFLVMMLTSLLVPLIISQAKPMYVIGRGAIIGLFPFVMLLGVPLARFGNRILVTVFCAVLIISLIASSLITDSKHIKYSDRVTTLHLIKHANDHDILVFTCLSRATIDYYLQLLSPDKPLHKISFPSEMTSHPGWIDVKKMLQNKEGLEEEADAIMDAINNSNLSDSNRIWLFYGSDKIIGKIIKDRFDNHLVLSEEKELKASFYERVLVYRKK